MSTQVLEREVHGIESVSSVLGEAQQAMEDKLLAFNDAIEGHSGLEIDGDIEGTSMATHKIKILNHDRKTAYTITLEAIMNQAAGDIIKALETGVKDRLYGITRIVGYYSRISNWNKSKLGELRDRHRGTYSVSKSSS